MSVAGAREVGDRRNEGLALGNLGSAYAALGEIRRALEFYEQSLVVAREIGDYRVEGDALFSLGLALDKLGDRTQAIVHAEAALEIFEQIESPQALRVREQLFRWHDSAG
jgi:tetratricopeptide (TPR) repeat protein